MGQHALQHHAQARHRHRRSRNAGLVQEDDERQPRRRGRQSLHTARALRHGIVPHHHAERRKHFGVAGSQNTAISAAWLCDHPTRGDKFRSGALGEPDRLRPGSTPGEAGLRERHRRRAAGGRRLRPAVPAGRRRGSDDQRARRHPDQQALHPVRAGPPAAGVRGINVRATTSASTAPRWTWPAPRSRWSSWTTSWWTSSAPPRRSPSGHSDGRAARSTTPGRGSSTCRPPRPAPERAARPSGGALRAP